jgi:hypothetical protein
MATEDDADIKKFAEELDLYYCNNNVYKCMIMCGDDYETMALAVHLSCHNHSVCTVCEEDSDDDRSLFMNRIKEFRDTNYHRIIIISYPMWQVVMPELEVYVLPEQNLIVLGDLSETAGDAVRRWLGDAYRRGFAAREDSNLISLGDMH